MAILERALDVFPSWTDILNDAERRLGSALDKSAVDTNFSKAVVSVNNRAYDIFQTYEKTAWATLIQNAKRAERRRTETTV